MSAPDFQLVRKFQTILDMNGMSERRVLNVVLWKPPNLVCQHTGSVCSYATLKLANGQPDYELFVKTMLTNGSTMNPLNNNFYGKEPDFFNVILGDVQAFYMKHSGSHKPLDFFPNCLYADKNEIIMENLVEMQGYHLNSKEKRQNMEYATMTLTTLAQYHAVTYAMIEELGGRDAAMAKYRPMREIMWLPNNTFVRMLENGKLIVTEILNNNSVPGGDRARALRLLSKFGSDLTARLIHEVSAASKHIFHVMNHGDLWNNNMLFLTDPLTGRLKHSVLLDFQVGRIGSPSLDLSLFMHTSVQDELRKHGWKDLLVVYYERLSAEAELLTNCPFPHSFDQLVADYRQKSLLGFWMNMFTSIMIEVMANITMDPSKMHGAHFINSIAKWIEANPGTARKRATLIVDMCDEYEAFLAELPHCPL